MLKSIFCDFRRAESRFLFFSDFRDGEIGVFDFRGAEVNFSDFRVGIFLFCFRDAEIHFSDFRGGEIELF